jgi:hypothetical protein
MDKSRAHGTVKKWPCVKRCTHKHGFPPAIRSRAGFRRHLAKGGLAQSHGATKFRTPFFFVPSERQDKPDGPCNLKGGCLANCSFSR